MEISVSEQTVDFGKELMGNTVLKYINVRNISDIAGPYVITGFSINATSDAKEVSINEDNVNAGSKCDVEGFSIEGNRIGYLKPGCSDSICFKWEPQCIGLAMSEFVISCPGCDDIKVTCKAECVDGSISLNAAIIDFKICLFNSPYEESIILTNRQATPKTIKCMIPNEVSKHIQVVPRKMLVQGNSSFNFKIKFQPRNTLSEDAPMYFDDKTSVLEVLISVQADDERELDIAVLAIVTTDDIAVSPPQFDFGVCTIYEKVRMPISVTNLSLLPQEVSFINLPAEIGLQSVLPFGKLCPLETVMVDLVFESTRDCMYNFNLQLTNGTNRIFQIKCTGRGKVPSLKISHQVLFFKATTPGDEAQHVICISNESWELHMFEFGSNENIPIHFSPKVNKLSPKQKSLVKISFRPTLKEEDVKVEASRLRRALKTCQSEDESLEKSEESEKGESWSSSPDQSFSSKELILARVSLLGRISQEQKIIHVPCFVATERNGIPEQKHDETLFLEIHYQTCLPELIVLTDEGANVIDFDNVLIGQSFIKTVTIQNISSRDIELKGSILDTFGNFEIMNALRTIHCQETQNLKIKFTPTCITKYCEEYKLRGNATNLCMKLKGKGCKPSLKMSLDKCLDFGRVMRGHVVEETIQITNESAVNINYNTVITYPHQNKCCADCQPTGFMNATKDTLEIYDCTPSRGEIKAGSSGEITVSFRSVLGGQQHHAACEIISYDQVLLKLDIRAQTEPHSFYIDGLNFHDEIIENFTLNPFLKEDSVPLIMRVQASKKKNSFLIGCSRLSNDSSVKRAIDWSIESIPIISELGFIISPMKGNIESGSHEKIYVSWIPNSNYKEGKSEQAVGTCTIRGDVTKTYKIIFFGVL